MSAYYNEIDPYAAQWLRNLIAAGHIAPGDVDERSIVDVRADDLRGYRQCHFFAGIGVWSYALRQAGWPDTRQVWTGSCPCQPFSAAGKGEGFADERHLWPAWFHLISQCRPRVLFGEQVASKPALAWLDVVSSDLAAARYTGWVTDLCAAGVGAPHIRQRLYFVAEQGGASPRRRAGQPAARSFITVAESNGGRHAARSIYGFGEAYEERSRHTVTGPSITLELADSDGRNARAERQQRSGEQRLVTQDGGAGELAYDEINGRREERQNAGGLACGDRAEGQPAGSESSGGPVILGDAEIGGGGTQHGESSAGARRKEPTGGPDISSGKLADDDDAGLEGRGEVRQRGDERAPRSGSVEGGVAEPDRSGSSEGQRNDQAAGYWDTTPAAGVDGRQHSACALNGFWRDADWLLCTDAKWRPVEPGTFPLVDGAPARVGRLRAYGNAIVAPVAAEFISAYLDVRNA